MKLYGTTTSPFVRRVRIVAAELGLGVELVNTAGEHGQALLRDISPIRKVPLAILDGHTLFDSHVIIDYLTMTRGYGHLEPARDRWREQNLVNAIDSALDSIIQLFYLRRDGVQVDGTVFATRQLERTDAVMTYLVEQLAPDRRSFGHGFGLAELALICTLDWMEFRSVYAPPLAGELAALRANWHDRPSVVATRPHA